MLGAINALEKMLNAWVNNQLQARWESQNLLAAYKKALKKTQTKPKQKAEDQAQLFHCPFSCKSPQKETSQNPGIADLR